MRPANAVLAAACLLLGMNAMAAPASPARAPLSLEEAMNAVNTSPRANIPAVRANAIRDSGMTYGATAGLAYQSAMNNQATERHAARYDTIFNFEPMMIGNVLPPVLTRAIDVYDQSADDVLRLVGETYRIEAQARFVSRAPNWREYVIRHYAQADAPSFNFASAEEKASFSAAVAEGWEAGVRQANAIFKEGLNRLKRDFEGMALYHVLLAQGRVTLPFVATASSAVGGSASSHINLDETLLRITARPEIVIDRTTWGRK